MRIIVLGIGLLSLAACAVGPDYEKPALMAPEAWGSDRESGGPAPDLARWWTSFGDPKLASLVERALTANIDLKIAGSRLREARAQAGFARGALLPSVGVGGSFDRARFSENGLFPGNADEHSLHRAGFDASWEIDVFGGRRREIEAAEADVEAAAEDRHAVLVSLLGEVARSYMELRGNQRMALVIRKNIEAARGRLELTRVRMGAGLATALDVARAEAQVAATEAILPDALRDARLASHRLAVLLGRDPQALTRELEADVPVPAPPARIGAGLPSELLSRRPDVRGAERRLASATARIGVAVSDLYPKFSIGASFGLESLDASDFFTAASRTWSFGPAVRWSLFEGGRIKANIEVMDARAEQAMLTYEQTFLLALEEVENALTAWIRERERHRALAESAAAAERSRELASDLHRKGLASFLEVLDAERVLYDAQQLLAAGDTAVALRAVALYKALGGGWE